MLVAWEGLDPVRAARPRAARERPSRFACTARASGSTARSYTLEFPLPRAPTTPWRSDERGHGPARPSQPRARRRAAERRGAARRRRPARAHPCRPPDRRAAAATAPPCRCAGSLPRPRSSPLSAVLAAVVAIDLVGSEERSGGIVERAVAAVSRENVIYAITERADGHHRGRSRPAATRSRPRAAARPFLALGRGRARFTPSGIGSLPNGMPRPAARGGGRPRPSGWFGSTRRRGSRGMCVDPRTARRNPPRQRLSRLQPGSDPGAQLRAHVESGRLRVAGRAVVRGRSAYRLVSSPRCRMPTGRDSSPRRSPTSWTPAPTCRSKFASEA